MILGINDKARYNRRVFLFSDAALDSGSLAMGVQRCCVRISTLEGQVGRKVIMDMPLMARPGCSVWYALIEFNIIYIIRTNVMMDKICRIGVIIVLVASMVAGPE